ncbi:MAG: hypothetical protein OEU98_04505, partial [Actinomycetota bacterium]|nr:hypothetical protein [Actinomycetota bacterium]
MIKKLVIGGTAAGLVLAGAASAAQLDTDGVAGKTLAAGDVTVSGAVLEDISFGTAWSQDFSSGSEGLHEHGGTVSTKDGIGIVNGSVFTRFGGYTTTSAGTWKASVDVYLDPTADTQFDYTVAANNAAKGHVQDFIFHAANTDTGLAIGASNNTDSKPVPGKTEYTVPEAGWYTLQHEFRADAEGHLVVDMTVVKDGKTAWTKSIKSKDGGKDVVF